MAPRKDAMRTDEIIDDPEEEGIIDDPEDDGIIDETSFFA